MTRDAAAMLALLDRERRHLLAGDLDGATALIVRKTELTDRLEQVGDPHDAEAIRTAATRNAALLEAAMTGIKGARARIDTIRHGAPTRLYASDGSRSEIAPVHHGLERRA